MSNPFLQEVRTHGWASVPFPLGSDELRDAADAFLDFCLIPQEQKVALHRYLEPSDEVSQLGYFRRAQSKGNYDDKEVWHHHVRAGELLKDEPGWQDERTQKFMKVADEILGVGIEVLTGVLANFEDEYPGLSERILKGGTAPKVYLRFIKYIPQKPGEFLAKGHFDRGGLAIAISESAPGLRLGKDIPSLTPLEHQEHRAVFMPGVVFHEATDSSFAPVWHDVIQKSEDQYRPDCARWAIVLFADVHDMISPTVEQARALLM
jgi:hypothetical protein